jgi:hypothetical protein
MKTSDIDLSLITLDGPTPGFDATLEDGQTNRFAYMKIGAYNLVLDLTVTFDSDVVDSQYGKYSWVTFDAEDLEKLLAIEAILDTNMQKLLGVEEIPYLRKMMFGDNYNYRLKIRGPLSSVVVEKGAKLNITCTPGFYFNELDSLYGCFLSSMKIGKPIKKVVKRK